ncbi:putative surface protein with fasciclin (FAS1) repeats [Sphingomonas jejuensis]|uniref:Surface protein with fasciclin (FAS1) repeats n=1 Tax=Sphingomonas jejuensis TaxID=904715 RepID=A0ABX0XMX2_9SPHN|nr:fasciclin domain-containing protein [Sphingomonas jejuensis]NJC34590.1 putative surface protein with fasciclin (FAS1) repeats [Sphingomonas jejuensis]
MVRPLLAATLLAVASPALAQGDMTPSTVDVVEVASAAGQYGSLLDAAMAAGLAETLATTDGLTVFAPIDAAFLAVDDLDALKADRTRLADTLRLHVVPRSYLSTDIPAGTTQVRTLAGETLTITNNNGTISVTDPSGARAMVVRADLRADNGVVHGINRVLSK